MSFLFGRPERRAASLSMFTDTSVIPPPSQAGTSPQLSGMEASLQKVAVWACVNLCATMAEVMPLQTFTGDGPTRQKLPLTTWMADLGGDGHGLPDWLYQLVLSLMLRGNAYGLVPAAMRDQRMGTPTMIQLQHPDKVHPYVPPPPLDATPQWYVNGQQVPTSQMWHRRVHPIPGRLLGASPIEMHALTLGLSLSAMRFGARWFEDGAHPSAVLSTDARIDEKQARTAKERFLGAIRGTREPVVLGGGWKYSAIQIAPNESQFLETNQYTSAECCRIFGPGFAELFGYDTGSSLTYANVEQRSLDVLTYAVDPWLVRVERILSALLPQPREVKFDRTALVRTDLLTRMRAHDIALRDEIMTVNEVRADLDMPPVDWGNEPRPIALPPKPIDKPTQLPDLEGNQP